MAASVYSHIRSAEGEIRLLAIGPAKNLEDPLFCYLQPAHLALLPRYEALSYTWGSPGLISNILLNGQPFSIQENAAAALRRLRHPHGARRVWVDAICINQEDVHEKEGQLPLMRKIYEEAEQTFTVQLVSPCRGRGESRA
ncbi:heterokaryon incompatibility protein-domain-containing protein [Cercophora newfieldiana]|uniref:Heterokaryon incompatibility protein-domain-containing protein n=1 Tax=Cercophora newfieldiana TaxID=92897 RepID=A0AA39Y8B6_9PEZI|nr:heterokaryon incompatibility protein-domain-containing protein [Cercophora newfieldiana]